MSDAPRDANNVPARLGATVGGTPTPWSIESATGYLNLNLLNGTLNTPVSVPSTAPRDGNNVPVLFGVDSGGIKRAVMIDHATGRVKCIITPP
jgi:hypothetical protein